MGAGKSTVAQLLAARFGCPSADTDELVERSRAMTVAELFEVQGEAAFRAAESGALRGLAMGDEPLVVSVGGGAVLDGANRGVIRSLGTVVWLRARPATLAARVGSGEGRPVLPLAVPGDASATGLFEALERLAEERRALYQEVADVVVDVDDISAAEVSELVLARLSELPGRWRENGAGLR